MEQDKRNFIVIIMIIIFITIGLGGYLVIKQKDAPQVEENKNVDSNRFKSEYEALNNKRINNTRYNYLTLQIEEKNPIKYISLDELNNMLENGTGIVYLGYSESNMCRNAINVLLTTARDKNVDTIYYLNMYEIRDNYIVENGELIKTIEAQDGYQKLLENLDTYLQDYVINDNSGNSYPIGEKRVEVPTVIAIKNGEIKSIHQKTVDSNTNEFSNLTRNQKNELYTIYNELVDSINKENEQTFCTSEEAC
ncbi:MAG: hypothetical protein IJ574_01830 [Bacilli bacterium]|nr:hypothetical protein [Bacilli bacterium]